MTKEFNLTEHIVKTPEAIEEIKKVQVAFDELLDVIETQKQEILRA